MRIRTIKPEFFTHPEVVACSIPARLLLVSMLTQADDAGRMYDQPLKILGLAFGEGDRVKVQPLLGELVVRGRVCRYDGGGKSCLHVVNFNKHQVISHKQRSVIPPCPLHDDSGNVPGTLTDDSGNVPGGNGMEWKGSGMEGNGILAPARPSRVRQPDAEWEAFCEVTNVNWHDLSDERRNAMNGMLKSLRSRGADAEEIRRRASNWPWDVAVTPEGLTKRWAELDAPRLKGSAATRELARRLREQGQ